MNTKLVMTASAVILAIAAVLLTFLPDVILENIQLNPEARGIGVLLLQITGALYFGFGMLNWTTRRNVIGGIYNKPIAIANFSHFFIAGMAILKGLFAQPQLPYLMWAAGLTYLLFAIYFGLISFRHPKAAEKAAKKKLI